MDIKKELSLLFSRAINFSKQLTVINNGGNKSRVERYRSSCKRCPDPYRAVR